MKRWLAIFLIAAMVGFSGGASLYFFGITRINRDNYVYIQGRADGQNDCKKHNTGVILPNGATEAIALENPPFGYRDST